MTDAVVLDLAAGRVYHFKHGWIPLDHIGRERLRAHGVNPDGYNVVHNGKLAANWRTRREAIAHADRLNGGKKAAAKVQPSQHAPGHHNVVKNGKLVATYQSEAGARRHADQLNAGTKAAASVHHATPTGTGARIDNPRSKVRTSARTLATRLPADGRDKTAPPRRATPPGTALQTRADAAVRMKADDLRTLAASGDKVAQAELDRRSANNAHVVARTMPVRGTATERAQQVAQHRHRTLEARRVAAEEKGGGVPRSGPGGVAKLADPMAYARGNLGRNDPAEVVKLRTDAELQDIARRMPNTAEGRAAKAELARRKAKR